MISGLARLLSTFIYISILGSALRVVRNAIGSHVELELKSNPCSTPCVCVEAKAFVIDRTDLLSPPWLSISLNPGLHVISKNFWQTNPTPPQLSNPLIATLISSYLNQGGCMDRLNISASSFFISARANLRPRVRSRTSKTQKITYT